MNSRGWIKDADLNFFDEIKHGIGCAMSDEDVREIAVALEEARVADLFSRGLKNELLDELARMDGDEMLTTRGNDDDEENDGIDVARKASGHPKENPRPKGTD